MRRLLSNGGILLTAILLWSCIEPYDPPLNDEDINYLVVDGFLNGSNGIATVRLSRTLPVKSEEPIPFETGAVVYIEDENGTITTLNPVIPGTYQGDINGLDPQHRYRLIIKTGDEHEYVSDFTTIVETPPIDSISWSVQRDGIQFEVNAHDPSNRSKFFKWKFEETYEYHTKLSSRYKFDPPDVVPRPSEESLSVCWRTNESRDIIIGSIDHLRESVLSRFPVTLVPYGSRKLFVKYSLLLQQQSLTKEAYEYWQSLERSTEHLGGLFDPLPSEVLGNISCIHHEGEKALGFFSAATTSEMRMFLIKNELPVEASSRFFDRTYCTADTVLMADIEFMPTTALFVDAVFDMGPAPIGYTVTSSECADCRYFGGTTTEPDFWE